MHGGKKHHEDPKKLFPTLDIGSHINAAPQPRAIHTEDKADVIARRLQQLVRPRRCLKRVAFKLFLSSFM
jgi:hypothetical protein